MDPRQYIEEYDYVQHRMPDEFRFTKQRTISTSHAWECIGPSRVDPPPGFPYYHGRVRSFHWYYDSTSSEWVPYLGASSGGLWKGQDLIFLRAWHPIGDNLPNLSVGAFAIHPQDPNRIVVGTGDWGRYNGGGVFYTTDGGGSWTESHLYNGIVLTVPAYISDIFYDPRDVGTLWLSSNTGLYKSINGGVSFYRATVAPSRPDLPIFDMVMDEQHPDTIYLATGYNQFLGSSAGIWQTVNAGATWEHLTTGLPFSGIGASISIDISRSSPEILYAAFTNSSNDTGGIFKTTNAGVTWNRTSSPPEKYIDIGQGFHTNTIRIHPTNPDIVYAGAVGFRRSTDGGQSWEIREPGHGDLTVIDFVPWNSRYVDLCGDGGFIIHDDSTNSTSDSTEYFSPGAFIQAYGFDYSWSDPSLMLSGVQDDGVILSTTGLGGLSTWLQVEGCDGGYSNIIDPLNPSAIFYTQYCGGPVPRKRSVDEGTTKEFIDGGLAATLFSPMAMNKPSTNYLFTVDPSNLYYTGDTDISWQRAAAGGMDFPSPLIPRGLEVSYGIGADSILCYVTFNDVSNNTRIRIAGGTPGSMIWRISYLPDYSIPRRIQADRWRGEYAYAFSQVSPYRIFKTTNGGRRWTDISGSDEGTRLPYVEKFTAVADPADPNVIYVGTTLGVFKTINNGSTWSKYQWGLPVVQVVDMACVPGAGHDTLRIATYGRGFWQRVLDGTDPGVLTIDGTLPLHDIATSGARGIAVSDSGMTLRTSDGGETWHAVPTSFFLPLFGIGFADSLTAVAAGKDGLLTLSTDGGGSWSQLNAPAGSTLRGVRFASHSLGFAYGDGGVILRTSDGGSSWQNTTNGFTGAVYGAAFKDTLFGLSVGYTLDANQNKQKLLLETTDGGQSWSQSQNLTGAGGLNEIIVEGKSFFIVGDAGFAARSEDDGQSWIPLQLPGQYSAKLLAGAVGPMYNPAGYVNPELFVGGEEGSMFATTDEGESWRELESGITLPVEGFAGLGMKMFAATGAGLLSRDLYEASVVTYHGQEGWGMVSRPVDVSDSTTAAVFPGAVSPAFAYAGSYVEAGTINLGTGYWIKFPFEASRVHIGDAVSSLSIPVQKGWNLIGSITSQVAVSAISSLPVNIMVSSFFGYDEGYVAADSLAPGTGHWIKVSEDGTLQLNAAAQMPKKTPASSQLEKENVLLITDARGRSGRLYFGDGSSFASSSYELPPLPPGGGFDIRYATGVMAECAAAQSGREVPILVTSASYPLRCSWTIASSYRSAELLAGGKVYSMRSGRTITLDAPGGLAIRFGAAEALPGEFSLEQNYPNPFNPTTTIRYAVPVAGRVTIRIFNILGQLVDVLEDAVEKPGYKTAEWDASGRASGLYVYSMTAVSQNTTFYKVRKMLLLK